MSKQIGTELEQLEQIKRRNRLQNNREKEAKRKTDDRRIFLVGEIFLDTFPEFLSLQPQKSAEGDEREFAPLKNFLTLLASKKKLVRLLKEMAAKQQL